MAIAAWERLLRMSVCQTTRSAPSPSKARSSMINFEAVLTKVRQCRRATQVCPIANARRDGSIS